MTFDLTFGDPVRKICKHCGASYIPGTSYILPTCSKGCHDFSPDDSNIHSPTKWLDFPSFPSKFGWICPVCGEGKAPFLTECDCVKTKKKEND